VKRGYRHLFLEGLGASMAPAFDHFVRTGERPGSPGGDGNTDAAARYRQRAFASWVGARKADFGKRQNAERTRFFDALREIGKGLGPDASPLRIHPLDIDMIPGGCYGAIERWLSAHPESSLDPLRVLVNKVEGDCPEETITGDLPITVMGSTAGKVNKISGSCFGEGPDHIYAWTAPEDGDFQMEIDTCPYQDCQDPMGFLYDSVLYVIDTKSRQMAVYRSFNGDGVELVGARRIAHDLKLVSWNDRTEEGMSPTELESGYRKFLDGKGTRGAPTEKGDGAGTKGADGEKR